ncbi:MAG: hypothetical protein FJZ58_07250 [Chlamydiae bacterium]|nr:hypothetical protein [Chlamydiota bacterium]
MSSVAILGAGMSGLVTAAKARAMGLQPSLFEQKNTLGGLWAPDGFTWERMTTNLSHHTCRFSDFPWPDGMQDFPTRQQVYEYLFAYAKDKQIEGCINFGTRVTRISPFEKQWKVCFVRSNIEQEAIYDYVVVATGVFSKANLPKLPGLEVFQGECFHSHAYKDPKSFSGKQVVVIGGSYSGTEISSEISEEAARVTHLFRRAYWVLPRYLPLQGRAQPLDLVFYSREASAASAPLSNTEYYANVHNWFRSLSRQHEVSSTLEVKAANQDPYFTSISDTYLKSIQQQKVIPICGEVARVEQDGVVISSGEKILADTLVLSTGYTCDLPFLPQELQEELGYRQEDLLQPLLLDRCVFPLKTENLAFVGMYRGPFFGVIEQQAAWVAKVFSRSAPIPSEEERKSGVEMALQIRDQQPRPQFPYPRYVEMMRLYSKLACTEPDLERLQQEDPDMYQLLWKKVPFTPDQLALTGDKKQLALQEINKLLSRVQCADV